MNVKSGERMKTLMFVDDNHVSEYQVNGYNILPQSYVLVKKKLFENIRLLYHVLFFVC